MCEKLKELIPRQQFDIPIQAAIGAKIISRETIKPCVKMLPQNVMVEISHVNENSLKNRKKGKKRMRQVGNVEIPQEAFMAVLKLKRLIRRRLGY